MNLFIQQKNKIIDLNYFLNIYIKPEIYKYFLNNINIDILRNWELYFKTQYKWDLGEIPQGAFDILLQGINNLQISNLGDNYTISINPNKLMPGTNAKLYDLCALINYGNLGMPPYPIFEKTFEDVANIIPILFEEYLY